MDFLNYNSVETLPGYEARAAFTVNSASVFREDVDIVPTIVDDTLSYIPWGGDNQMPFDLLALVEKDETLATCQCFNAEVCYGSGLQYCVKDSSAATRRVVDDFLLDNDLAAYFLGICQDFKHFGFAVSVLILNEDGTKIVRLLRKEACYCRFTPADKHGRISKILYANCVNPSRRGATSRKSTCSTLLLRGEICKTNSPSHRPWALRPRRTRSAGSSLSSAVFLRLTQPIIPFLIMARCSAASGTTSSSLSASQRKRS